MFGLIKMFLDAYQHLSIPTKIPPRKKGHLSNRTKAVTAATPPSCLQYEDSHGFRWNGFQETLIKFFTNSWHQKQQSDYIWFYAPLLSSVTLLLCLDPLFDTTRVANNHAVFYLYLKQQNAFHGHVRHICNHTLHISNKIISCIGIDRTYNMDIGLMEEILHQLIW